MIKWDKRKRDNTDKKSRSVGRERERNVTTQMTSQGRVGDRRKGGKGGGG